MLQLSGMDALERLQHNLPRLLAQGPLKTQLALAEKLGVSASTISNWMNSRNGTTLEMLDRIAAAMEIDVSLLLTPTPEELAETRTAIENALRANLNGASLAEPNQEAPTDAPGRLDVSAEAAALRALESAIKSAAAAVSAAVDEVTRLRHPRADRKP